MGSKIYFLLLGLLLSGVLIAAQEEGSGSGDAEAAAEGSGKFFVQILPNIAHLKAKTCQNITVKVVLQDNVQKI